jgi:hypothetical protein
MESKLRSNLIKLSITYVIVAIALSVFDYLTSGSMDWGVNLFLTLFMMGIILLYGGLLDLWTKRNRGL